VDSVFELLFGIIHSLFGRLGEKRRARREARAGAEQDKGTPVA